MHNTDHSVGTFQILNHLQNRGKWYRYTERIQTWIVTRFSDVNVKQMRTLVEIYIFSKSLKHFQEFGQLFSHESQKPYSI